MAKPATRMKTIVLKSYSESHSRRLARSPVVDAPRERHEREDCAALSVCCEQPTASCSPALRDDLRATIEDMVIPRLLIGQSLSPAREPQLRGRMLPTQPEVDLLARIAVQPDLDSALELALGMLGAGLSLETVLLHLISPAARRLGSDWEEDLRSFADVTVGLGTLHELVHVLAQRDAGDAAALSVQKHSRTGTDPWHRNVLLVGGPGEQHTLGLYIFAELLRRSSWTVTVEAAMPDSALLQAVRAQSVDVVGIACSSHERLMVLAKLIQGIRRASQNRALRVVVGGPVDLAEEARRNGLPFYGDARDAIDWLDGK